MSTDRVKRELRYAHLSNSDSPVRRANREHILAIQAEEERQNARE